MVLFTCVAHQNQKKLLLDLFVTVTTIKISIERERERAAGLGKRGWWEVVAMERQGSRVSLQGCGLPINVVLQWCSNVFPNIVESAMIGFDGVECNE
ncbi:hypothetical protein Sjap_012919 [Stephania japonica]|uniref:Uncharacterized protein n=1 Tax=Stephania japonica TaxID=461633 RepID=A0AAP0IYX9_9MAGN